MRRRRHRTSPPRIESSTSWTSVFTDRPKSSDPSLFFTIEVRVTWRRHLDVAAPVHRHTAARMAREAVEVAAGRCDVLRPEAAEQDILAALKEQLPLGADGVIITDIQTQVNVDDATREAALRLERLQHDQRLREELLHQEHRQQQERIRHDHELDDLARRQARAREAFLREEILADPAAARLYGLLEGASQHWPRLGGPPPGTDLEGLVREIRQWRPGQRWVSVAQLLHDFISSLTEEGRKELLTILADAVRTFGDEETGHRLALLAGDEE